MEKTLQSLNIITGYDEICAEITPASKFSWSKEKKVLTIKTFFTRRKEKRERHDTLVCIIDKIILSKDTGNEKQKNV